jgi:hypothetical protein
VLKGTTSKEAVETGSYGKFFVMDKFPEFLDRPSYSEFHVVEWGFFKKANRAVYSLLYFIAVCG